MSDEKTRITVDIYGIQYKLMGNSSSKYMKKVAEHVNDQMHLIAKGHPRLDTPRISVLAAVNIADDYFKLKNELDKSRNDPQVKSMEEAYRALEEENGRLQKELLQKTEQTETWERQEHELKEELSQWRQRYDELKQAHEDGQQQSKSELESQQEMRVRYEKLQDEYTKLQNEYNEWIQLVEQDPERS